VGVGVEKERKERESSLPLFALSFLRTHTHKVQDKNWSNYLFFSKGRIAAASPQHGHEFWGEALLLRLLLLGVGREALKGGVGGSSGKVRHQVVVLGLLLLQLLLLLCLLLLLLLLEQKEVLQLRLVGLLPLLLLLLLEGLLVLVLLLLEKVALGEHHPLLLLLRHPSHT